MSQVAASLAVVAISLASFAIFDVWEKSPDARVAAMVIALPITYPVIILYRMVIRRRDWDLQIDIAFIAGVLAVIALVGLVGPVLVILTISIWGTIAIIRYLKKGAGCGRSQLVSGAFQPSSLDPVDGDLDFSPLDRWALINSLSWLLTQPAFIFA